jgi:hypothetical protein
VVIEQQNMGGRAQVGGGEFKNATGEKSVDQAAAEQAQLERDVPIGQGGDGPGGDADIDVESPGASVLGLQSGDPVEPNEPA